MNKHLMVIAGLCGPLGVIPSFLVAVKFDNFCNFQFTTVFKSNTSSLILKAM